MTWLLTAILISIPLSLALMSLDPVSCLLTCRRSCSSHPASLSDSRLLRPTPQVRPIRRTPTANVWYRRVLQTCSRWLPLRCCRCRVWGRSLCRTDSRRTVLAGCRQPWRCIPSKRRVHRLPAEAQQCCRCSLPMVRRCLLLAVVKSVSLNLTVTLVPTRLAKPLAFFDVQVDLSVFLEAGVDPGAFACLDRTRNDDAFSELAPLVGPEVVRDVERVHEARVLELRSHWKQRLAEVRRSLEVLQVAYKELGRVRFRKRTAVLAATVDDDQLVDFVDSGCSGDLRHQVRFKFEALSVVDDCCGYCERHSSLVIAVWLPIVVMNCNSVLLWLLN